MGRVRVRDHPQLPADGCDQPGRPHRLASPIAFRAPRRPPRVRLTAPPACRAGPGVTAAGPGGPALPGRVAVRARLRPEGSERVHHGAADRFVASVPVKLLLITDTDAPHSVVAVAEKIEEVRLRRASGSREWLGPVRWCGFAVGGPSVVRATAGKAAVTSPGSLGRYRRNASTATQAS